MSLVRRWGWTAGLLLASVLAAVLAPILLLPLGCVAVASALPAEVLVGTRLFLSAIVLYAWILAATAVLQLIGWGLHPIATLVPLIILALAVHARRPGVGAMARPARRWQLVSLLPLAAAIGVTGFLLSSATWDSFAEGGIGLRAAMLGASEDGATHFAFYRLALDHGGFLYDVEYPRNAYPHGTHVAFAFVARAWDATVGVGGPGRPAHFDAFWASALSTMALLTWAFAALVSEVARRLGASAWIAAVATLIAAAFVVFGLPAELIATGFYPQVLGLSVLLSMFVAATALETAHRWTVFGLLALALPLVSLTWFFLLPIAGVAALAWSWIERRTLLDHAWPAGAVVAVSLALTVVPVALGRYLVSSGTANASGGVAAPPREAIVTIVGAAFVLVSLALRRRDARPMVPLMVGGVTAVTFSIGFLIYQRSTIGTTAYFFEKSLYSVYLLAMAMAVAATAALLTDAVVGRARPMRLALPLVVALIGIGLLSPTAPKYRENSPIWQLRDGRRGNPLAPLFIRYFGEARTLRGRDIVVWKVSDSPYVDFLASRWLNAMNSRRGLDLQALQFASVTELDPDALATYTSTTTARSLIFTSDPEEVRFTLGTALDADEMARVEIIDTSA